MDSTNPDHVVKSGNGEDIGRHCLFNSKAPYLEEIIFIAL
jgi:hypothetical protein